MKYSEIRPIYNNLKKYIGTNYQQLTDFANHDAFLDKEVNLPEFVSFDEVSKLLHKYFEVYIPDEVVSVLWLNANVNYESKYLATQEYINDNIVDIVGEDQFYWEDIQKDLLHLYVFLNQNTDAAMTPLKLSRGKRCSINIDNTLNWLTCFLNNYCFPTVLPAISTVTDAENKLKEMTKKPRGRKVERPMENAIINGVAQIATDYKLIKDEAPLNLCDFIYDYLCMMKVIKVDDPYINSERIGKQIPKLKEYVHSPVLFTPEGRIVTLEELVEMDKNSPERMIRFLTEKPQEEANHL